MAAPTTTKAVINNTGFEAGCYIDGGTMNADDFNIATLKFADTTLGGTRFADTAAGDIAVIKADTLGDTLGDNIDDASMGLTEAADTAVDALNDATVGAFFWDVTDGCLVLFPEDD